MGCFFHDPGDEIYHLTVFSDREIGAIFRYQVFSGWINQPTWFKLWGAGCRDMNCYIFRSPATRSRKIFGKYPGRPLDTSFCPCKVGWNTRNTTAELLVGFGWVAHRIIRFRRLHPSLVWFFVGSIPLFHSGVFKSTWMIRRMNHMRSPGNSNHILTGEIPLFLMEIFPWNSYGTVLGPEIPKKSKHETPILIDVYICIDIVLSPIIFQLFEDFLFFSESALLTVWNPSFLERFPRKSPPRHSHGVHRACRGRNMPSRWLLWRRLAFCCFWIDSGEYGFVWKCWVYSQWNSHFS